MPPIRPPTVHVMGGRPVAYGGASDYASEYAPPPSRRDPQMVGVIVDLRGDRMVVSFGPGIIVDVDKIDGARVGYRVLCARDTQRAIELVEDKVPTGPIVVVKRVHKDAIEAEVVGALKAIYSSIKCKVGERVVLDGSLSYVIGSLGAPPAENVRPPKVSVSWDDVGGQEEAKEALREAIELPLAHKELFAGYGKKGVKGVLLLGAAGCGKTLIAKAAATSIARQHGQSSTEGFIYIKGPEILSKWIGESERQIRAMFEAARQHRAKHGYPALVFIDECDALLGIRDRGSNTNLNATIVPQFLAEMDGLDDSAAIFVLATNRADMLDPAVVREGRVDRKVRVARPTEVDARRIFEIHLRGRPLAGTGHVERGVAEIYSAARVLRKIDDKMSLRMRDMASGAMIAGVVEQASTFALLRDVEENRRSASGISPEHLTMAVDKAQKGLMETDHGEVIRELLEVAQREKLR